MGFRYQHDLAQVTFGGAFERRVSCVAHTPWAGVGLKNSGQRLEYRTPASGHKRKSSQRAYSVRITSKSDIVDAFWHFRFVCQTQSFGIVLEKRNRLPSLGNRRAFIFPGVTLSE